MRKLFVTLVAVAAVAAFSAPSLAKNDGNREPLGQNTHAHQGGTKPDPQPDHGKDNNSAGETCQFC
jgi:hypothetical protein